jgi:hypothetical protein
MLVDRMSLDDALLTAEQAFPTILQALEVQMQQTETFDTNRWGAGRPIADDELDSFFDPILQHLDGGDLALQLSYGINAHAERVNQARSAQAHFKQALQELADADDAIRNLQFWQEAHDTGQQSLHAANKRLRDLGE